jgi:hypothetical protein
VRIEQIICSGLKPPYDGSSERLLLTLQLIHIRRQNEVWSPATYLQQGNKTIDLVLQFSAISEQTVLNQAKKLWDASDASVQRHVRGSPTSNARLFGTFLLNSLTPEFASIVFSRIDSKYCTDGPLILFTICQHLHRNHLAFVESIKTKIRAKTLMEFNNDVPNYLRFLSDHLKLISSTGSGDGDHNDLIQHILMQLRGTTILLFQQSVLKWQRDYYEQNLTLTSISLVQKADQEVCILQHAGQWVETIDPSVTAMQALLSDTKAKSSDLIQSLVANFSQHSQRGREYYHPSRQSAKSHASFGRQQTPDWLLDRPDNLNQTKSFNGRQWYFCTKCGRSGRWVCTHTTETHGDRSRSSSPATKGRYHSQSSDRARSRSPPRPDPYADRHSSRRWDSRSQSRSPHHGGTTSDNHQSPRRQHMSWSAPAVSTPVAKLSLLDSINTFFDED